MESTNNFVDGDDTFGANRKCHRGLLGRVGREVAREVEREVVAANGTASGCNTYKAVETKIVLTC